MKISTGTTVELTNEIPIRNHITICVNPRALNPKILPVNNSFELQLDIIISISLFDFSSTRLLINIPPV